MTNPVDFIHEETNLAKHVTNALGYAQPMVLPFRNIVVVSKGSNGKYAYDSVDAIKKPSDDKYAYENIDTIRKPDEGKMEKGLSNLGDNFFQCPLSFMIDGVEWRLPVDPLVSVSGKNVIKRRYVAKSSNRGSIKECWSQDDYDVNISGVIIAEDAVKLVEHLSNLRKVCNMAESVEIVSEFLNNPSTFGINRIAIESYDFPFTKGLENQSFTIKAYSDDSYMLLEEA